MSMDGTSVHLAAEDLGGQQRVLHNGHSVGNMVNAFISRSERWPPFVLQQVATLPPQRQKTIHFLMVVAARIPCQACTHDGGGRVLDTQPSAGT